MHAALILGIQLFGVALFACAAAVGSGVSAALAALGLVLYWGGSIAFVIIVECAVRRAVAQTGQRPVLLRLAAVLRLLVAVPLTNLVYPYAVLAMQRTTELTWRGVRYRVGGPHDIELREYQPCKPES